MPLEYNLNSSLKEKQTALLPTMNEATSNEIAPDKISGRISEEYVRAWGVWNKHPKLQGRKDGGREGRKGMWEEKGGKRETSTAATQLQQGKKNRVLWKGDRQTSIGAK